VLDIDLSDPAIPSRPGPSTMTWIGTATVLLRCGGFTVLTDPNFLHAGEHAPLGYGLRSRRLTDPAMELDDLPPLDLVLLSHHHGDHFDPEVAERLPSTTRIVTEPHSAKKLERQGFTEVIALEPWTSARFRRGDERLTITAVPGRHAPGALQRFLPKVMGSVVQHSSGLRVYVTGDTLLDEVLRDIPRHFPTIDACLLHLGGTRIAGVLLTMDATQGVGLLQLVRPRVAYPIHHGDYTVFKDPIERFRDEVAVADVATDVRFVERGETVELPAPADVRP